MKLSELSQLRMTGNVYNRGDADNWMTIPHFSEVRRTSYYDGDNVVLFDKKLVEDLDAEKQQIDLVSFFKQFNNEK